MARQMKDSGIAWIGEIPEGWSCGQLGKYVTVFNGDRSSNYPTPEELHSEGIPFFTSFDLDADEICMHSEGKYLNRDKYERLGGYKAQIGDIVFCLRGSVGKCSINMRYSEGTVASSLMGMRCHSIDNKFAFYTLTSDVVGIQNDMLMNGTCAANLSAKNVCKYKVVLPSLAEQHRIADFLDARCAEIDAVIERTKATIEEYKKLKQAVITEAVTKGVRGPRKMKDSGIEWIGEIPEEWEIVKMKHLGKCRNGLTYSPENVCDDNGTLVLRSSNIQNGKLCFEDNVYVDCQIRDELMVKEGDILICSRNGSRALIGKNALIPADVVASFGAFMMVFRCECSEYVHLILNSAVFNYYLGTFLTATINQLTADNFSNMQIVYCPDISEQQEIIDYLKEKYTSIDTIIAKKTALLTELETYKKSLIYEYVTGKKEVV